MKGCPGLQYVFACNIALQHSLYYRQHIYILSKE
jgi:hypothetical protein